MPCLPIVKIGHDVLRTPCAKVDFAEIQNSHYESFIRDMIDTMHKEQGVGLAANQVGRNASVIVLECCSNPRYPSLGDVPLEICFNPVILECSKEIEEDWEGCLSIPGYRGRVPRSKTVTFEALNQNGKAVHRTVMGFHARIIQHEIDHINGLFYVDRMPDLHHWTHLEEFNKKFGLELPDEGSS